jgi:amino acid permease
MIIIYSCGIVIGFQIIAGALTMETIKDFGVNWNPQALRAIVMVVLNILCMMPLSLMRDLSALRFTSFFAPFALTYIALVTVIEFYWYYEEHQIQHLELVKIDQNIFSCIAIPLVAYMSHTNVVTVLGQITNPSHRRMEKMTDRVIYIVLGVYLLLGTFGYLSTTHNTPNIFTSRKDADDIKPDIAMTLGRIFMVIALVFSVPVNVSPCRSSILAMLRKQKDTSVLLFRSLTVAMLLITLGVAIAVPNVIIVFNFLGGICPIMLCIVYPGMIYVRLHEEVPKYKKVVFLFGVFIMTLIGIATVIVTILEIFGAG